MPLIKKRTKGYIDLANPSSDDICFRSIAHGLSNICRFTGQCPQFYSVAEHSLLCAALGMEDNLPTGAIKALLLHDAAEAFLGDISTPLKNLLPDFRILEARMMEAIEKKCGIRFNAWGATVEYYDKVMLKAEKRAFWPEIDDEEWDLEYVDDRKVPFSMLSPDGAEQAFATALSFLFLA